jgi:hypothetical protein
LKERNQVKNHKCEALFSHYFVDAYESVLARRYSGKAVVPFSFKFFVFGHVDFLELFEFLILH